MKKNITIILALICSIQIYGQQFPQLSLRNYDMMNYNPAVAGSQSNQEVKLHHRSQWVGFENSPKTNIFSYNGSIKNNIGIGGSIFYDTEVTTKNFGANLMYSYHLLFDRFNISLGANTGIQQYQFNTSELDAYNETDPLVSGSTMRTKYIPIVGGGAFMYNQNYYVGTSFSYYLPTAMSEGIEGKTTSALYYYLMGGYNFQITDNFDLLGQAFIEGQANYTQYDIGIRASFMESFFFGVGYRPKDAVVLSSGIKIFKSILVAYSYDIVTTQLRNYNSGSHELVVSYQFNRSKPQYYRDKNRIHKKISWN